MSRPIRLIQNLRRHFSTSISKFDAAYDGPGKTTVKILNENPYKIMIDSFSRYGFTLNNKMNLMGPSIILPDSIVQWKITDTLEVSRIFSKNLVQKTSTFKFHLYEVIEVLYFYVKRSTRKSDKTCCIYCYKKFTFFYF